jgi:hypothetical protein
MKKFPVILLLIFIFQSGLAQDKLNTKDKQQLTVQVIERTNKVVKYKMIDYFDGPVIWIKINRLSSIEYKNGTVDLLGYQNPRKSRPYGINAGMALEPTRGGGMFSSTLDYFIIPQIDMEINVGIADLSSGVYFSAGSRIHLNPNTSVNKLTPFTGVLFGSNFGDEFCQIPVGVNYLTNLGINASLSVNEMIGFESWQTTFIELRIGWRFKR